MLDKDTLDIIIICHIAKISLHCSATAKTKTWPWFTKNAYLVTVMVYQFRSSIQAIRSV
jgi:hypothetical protein